jgi:hypothetical protein
MGVRVKALVRNFTCFAQERHCNTGNYLQILGSWPRAPVRVFVENVGVKLDLAPWNRGRAPALY